MQIFHQYCDGIIFVQLFGFYNREVMTDIVTALLQTNVIIKINSCTIDGYYATLIL